MVSSKFFALLTLLSLAATPALAQTPALVLPGQAPPDPTLVTSGPPDREMPEDKLLFIDPHAEVGVVGFDDTVAFGGSVGLDIHFRLHRFHSVALLTSFGGAGLLTEPEVEDDGRGAYDYAFGLAYGLRTNEDKFRIVLGVDFAGLRTSRDLVIAHGTRVVLRIEFAPTPQVMVRINLRPGPGWGGVDEELGVFYGANVGVAYSF